jgi:hypothetical protein
MLHNLIKEMKKTQIICHTSLIFIEYSINNTQFIFSHFHQLKTTLEVIYINHQKQHEPAT